MDELVIEPKLGPFFDEDGQEFIPVGFEESLEPLGASMGTYEIRSTLPDLHSAPLIIEPQDLTAFIQEDWDRVMAGNSPRAFLLATRAGAYAAGRIAEEVVLKKLFTSNSIYGSAIEKVLYFWQAEDLQMIIRPKGTRSDDLVLLFSDGSIAALESKAVFRPTPYLRRSLPKINRQLRSTLLANPSAVWAMAALIDLSAHRLSFSACKRDEFLNQGGLLWDKECII